MGVGEPWPAVQASETRGAHVSAALCRPVLVSRLLRYDQGQEELGVLVSRRPVGTPQDFCHVQ